jgi:hypothetical protein
MLSIPCTICPPGVLKNPPLLRSANLVIIPRMTVVPMKGKSIGHTKYPWFLKKGSKSCAQKAKLSVTVVNIYLVLTYNVTQ